MFGAADVPFLVDDNWVQLVERPEGSLFGYMTWTDPVGEDTLRGRGQGRSGRRHSREARESRETSDGNDGPVISQGGRLVPQLLERPFAGPAVALDRGERQQVRQLAELPAADVQVKLQ